MLDHGPNFCSSMIVAITSTITEYTSMPSYQNETTTKQTDSPHNKIFSLALLPSRESGRDKKEKPGSFEPRLEWCNAEAS